MVSGFNHIDLGTIDSSPYHIKGELLDRIMGMTKNDKPLICSANVLSFGAIDVVMSRFGGSGDTVYGASMYPLFVCSLTVTQDGAEFSFEDFSE